MGLHHSQELFANLLMTLSNSSFFFWTSTVHTLEWCMETSAKWDFIIPAVAVLWIWIDLSDIHLHLPSVSQHNAENYLSAPLSVHTLEDLGNSGLSQLVMDLHGVIKKDGVLKNSIISCRRGEWRYTSQTDWAEMPRNRFNCMPVFPRDPRELAADGIVCASSDSKLIRSYWLRPICCMLGQLPPVLAFGFPSNLEMPALHYSIWMCTGQPANLH